MHLAPKFEAHVFAMQVVHRMRYSRALLVMSNAVVGYPSALTVAPPEGQDVKMEDAASNRASQGSTPSRPTRSSQQQASGALQPSEVFVSYRTHQSCINLAERSRSYNIYRIRLTSQRAVVAAIAETTVKYWSWCSWGNLSDAPAQEGSFPTRPVARCHYSSNNSHF